MPAEPIATYVITAHAAFEMPRRGISEEMVRDVMIAPEQRLLVRTGRVVLVDECHLRGSPASELAGLSVRVGLISPL